MKRFTRSGFTLIEVMVVMIVISTLAAILFPVLFNTRESARRAVCLSNVKQISLALRLYASDSDDYYPPSMGGKETLSDGVDHDISWISMVQPYAERVFRVNDRGKSKDDLNASRGVVQLFVCPLQQPDYRAALNSIGALRLSSSGVGVSYALPPYAASARSQSEFESPVTTISLAEQYLNFTNTYFYPADWDDDAEASTYGVRTAINGDCRFDRPVACSFGGITTPASPDTMPGIQGNFISNVGRWHRAGQTFGFNDGHAHFQKLSATYTPDGKFSEWTLSGHWNWARP